MLPVNRVLCPTDLSAGSHNQVRAAAELARSLGADLILLHVVNPMAFALATHEAFGESMAVSARAIDAAMASARGTLHKLAADARALGVLTEPLVLLGSPGDTILKAARTERVGLLVMGTRHRSLLRRLFLASPTETVLRAAPCPVLVVPVIIPSGPAVPPALA